MSEPNPLTVVLLQPGYLPWIGFFEQLYTSDIFVVFDDAQYTRLDWRNRNRIKSPNGEAVYITVPVKKCSTSTIIKDVKISYEQDWPMKHLRILKSYYQKAPFFDKYYGCISQIISKRHEFLVDLDTELIFVLSDLLGIKRKILFSSELKTPARGKERLLAVCEELGATRCYEGFVGRKIFDPQTFLQKGIMLEFQEFKTPPYPQLWGDFIPRLSVIDLLFNCGDESINVVVEGGIKQETALKKKTN